MWSFGSWTEKRMGTCGRRAGRVKKKVPRLTQRRAFALATAVRMLSRLSTGCGHTPILKHPAENRNFIHEKASLPPHDSSARAGLPTFALAASKKPPAATPAPAGATPAPEQKETRPFPYHGDVSTVDAAAKIFTMKSKEGNVRTFHVGETAKVTKVSKDGPAADFSIVTVGSYAAGTCTKAGDRKYEVVTLHIGPKPAKKEKASAAASKTPGGPPASATPASESELISRTRAFSATKLARRGLIFAKCAIAPEIRRLRLAVSPFPPILLSHADHVASASCADFLSAPRPPAEDPDAEKEHPADPDSAESHPEDGARIRGRASAGAADALRTI